MMNGARVRVRRDRPSAVAWSVALATTMLAVYVLTLNASLPDAVERVSAAPRVTREIELEPLEGWCVSLGRFSTAEQARIEAAGYAASGAAGCAWQVDGAWHVLGTMVATEKEAERAARRLREENDIEADALRLSAEGVKLRITAPELQIELIKAAAAALREQAAQLSDMARQLDRGELQPEATRTLCALAATETGELGKRLAAIPGADENALCASLIDALARLSVGLQEIAGSGRSSAPALSGMLRMAGIDSFLNLKAAQDVLRRNS